MSFIILFGDSLNLNVDISQLNFLFCSLGLIGETSKRKQAAREQSVFIWNIFCLSGRPSVVPQKQYLTSTLQIFYRIGRHRTHANTASNSQEAKKKEFLFFVCVFCISFLLCITQHNQQWLEGMQQK